MAPKRRVAIPRRGLAVTLCTFMVALQFCNCHRDRLWLIPFTAKTALPEFAMKEPAMAIRYTAPTAYAEPSMVIVVVQVNGATVAAQKGNAAAARVFVD